MILRNLELWAGALSAAVLLIGTFLVHAPVWLSLLVAVLLFAGIGLIASYWTDLQIQRQAKGMTVEVLQAEIREGLEKVKEIHGLTEKIQERVVRDQIGRICGLAQRIFQNFKDDPSDVGRASRFLLYLNRFLPLIEKYARLSSTKAGRELLEKSSSDVEFRELLGVVEQGFTQGFQNYLRNDVVELQTLGRVLRKMMNVAEIGG